MEGLEMICFQIISNVGTARSNYIEAIHKAKERDFAGARACVEAGQQEFLMTPISSCCSGKPKAIR